MIKAISATALIFLVFLTGCTTTESFDVPGGEQAYAVIAPERVEADQPEYRINALDSLSIRVFREPDLDIESATVESGGGIVMPLVGRVQAAGRTTTELSRAVENELIKNGLRNPKVSVTIADTETQNVTVDGAVNQAGVYALSGTTTLLQSIARARGATRTAQLNKVAIFRTIDGQRNGALFDVLAIREGRAPDPYIRPGDYVVVGSSGIKSFYNDALSVLPAFGLFVPLVQ